MPRTISTIVEEQVLRWRAESQEPQALVEELRPPPHAVTVAHQIGSSGRAIACRVAELLGVTAYDREVVEHIAARAAVQVETVETLDERVQSRIDAYLTAIFRERNFDRGDYMRGLSRTVVALWEHGPCVIVGHGCVHLVPREQALAVWFVAPEEVRVRRVARQHDLDLQEARRLVRRTDAERAAFHHRYFGASLHEPSNFDLILDTSRLDVDACAAVVYELYQRRFGEAAIGARGASAVA